MKKSKDDRMNYDENGYYMDELEEKEQKSKGASLIEKILGIFLVVWFFLSVGLMIYLSRTSHNDYRIVLLLFQLFMVFGIVITISEGLKKRFHILPVLFIVIGIIGLIMTYAYNNGSEETKKSVLKLMVILIPIVFIGVGIYSVVSQLLSMKGNAERCTVAVTAVCTNVSVSSTNVNGRVTRYYNPTYEYTYETETYKANAVNVLTDRCVGMNYEIMIDPDDPKTIYDPDSKRTYAFVVAFGLLFVLMPLIMLICVIKFAKF